MTTSRIPVNLLGQSGCKFVFNSTTVYVDPYLSNSVQELDSSDLKRLIPIPFLPENVTDADWVLLTHAHIDHCDPHTIPKLATSSPQARFIAPLPVVEILLHWGVSEDRILLADEHWNELGSGLNVRAIPAAHPEITRDESGNLSCVGYLLEYVGKRIYLAGDTFARQEILDAVRADGPIHTAFLPVNEHNFFRNRRGIIGNMSVREAFQFAEELGAQQVVAVHWDMFEANSVDPDEIKTIYQSLRPTFNLLIRPTILNLADLRISIIVRTFNEARHLADLLKSITGQRSEELAHEVIIVDSGSTDATLEIAERHGCIIRHITREEFSFGRSLNIGCEAAQGDFLVIISGHCVPLDEHWLQRLVKPLIDGSAVYAYGRQHGGPSSHFSECRIFNKYFPPDQPITSNTCFCNNANAALLHSSWAAYRFDEELTGLEDMELAQRMQRDGGKIAYVPDAGVYHYHDESWRLIRRRFEREAIALHTIMPQVHVSGIDTARYIVTSVWKDLKHAIHEKVIFKNFVDIILYRWHQYLGSYCGNRQHRLLSHAEKELFFFPD